MWRTDGVLIELWGGPCDGELRMVYPEQNSEFWTTPVWAQDNLEYPRCWYRVVHGFPKSRGAFVTTEARPS